MLKPKIIVACVVALGAIVVAIIQVYPSWHRPSTPENVSISGMIVDSISNKGIPQASVSIVGRTEHSVTEDNGNFVISLLPDKSKLVRLHVTKSGYLPLDQGIQAPADNLIFQLQKQ
jgi:hypothetical protein